jgi:hypothetical protein
MRGIVVGLALLSLGAPALSAQSVLDRTPNTAGVWTLDPWSPVFVFAHRFAFIEGGAYYHNPSDTVANVDPASMQHHGANMLALARAFGERDLATLGGSIGRGPAQAQQLTCLFDADRRGKVLQRGHGDASWFVS